MREGKGLGFTCPLSFTVVTTLTCKVARKAASTKETTSRCNYWPAFVCSNFSNKALGSTIQTTGLDVHFVLVFLFNYYEIFYLNLKD